MEKEHNPTLTTLKGCVGSTCILGQRWPPKQLQNLIFSQHLMLTEID